MKSLSRMAAILKIGPKTQFRSLFFTGTSKILKIGSKTYLKMLVSEDLLGGAGKP